MTGVRKRRRKREKRKKIRHRTCEMDELLALRARVKTLERDVAGPEAIVHHLDEKREDFDTLESQVVRLFADTASNQWFVPCSGPPEDELVSIIILNVNHQRSVQES